MTRDGLLNELIAEGYLKTPRIVEAFEAVDRIHFVPEESRGDAYLNIPLPIGYGATISQPLVVAFMLEALAPDEGNKVLDTGSGSGWTSTLFAHIVGPRGKVFGMEIVPELAARAEQTVQQHYPELARRITFIAQSAEEGLANEAPFDCIQAAAAVEEIPEIWKHQLTIGGRMMIPSGGSLILIERASQTRYNEKVFHGFSFVPFQY